MHCEDSPTYILDQSMYLFPLSKETDRERLGELRLVFVDQETCDDDCRTLKTMHELDLPLQSSQNDHCDSAKARLLDGRLHVCDLTHALANGDFNERGTAARLAASAQWLRRGQRAARTSAVWKVPAPWDAWTDEESGRPSGYAPPLSATLTSSRISASLAASSRASRVCVLDSVLGRDSPDRGIGVTLCRAKTRTLL